MTRFVLHLALMGAIVAPIADDAYPQTLPRTASPAAVAPASRPAETREAVEVLDGLDPVMLVRGQEAFGKTDLGVTRGRYTYLFASAETRAEFEKNPAPYEVQLGGLCARMGGATGSNPNLYAVHEGRIYLFGSEDCRKLFATAPAKYLPRPVEALPASREAAARASALLAKAVDALGGAAKVDGLTSYVETGTMTLPTGMGEQTVTMVVSRRMPEDVRTDRTMMRDGKSMTSTTVWTKEDAFFLGQGRVFPVAEEGRPNMETEYARHPLVLLRARRDPAFKAAVLDVAPANTNASANAAAGAAAAPASSVKADLVGIRFRGVAATLGLDPDTGRIASLSYVDRDPQGRYATITLLYGDYRPAGGLTLPFSQTALVDGAAAPALTRSLTAIDINPPLDAAFFARPVQASQP